MSFVKIQLNGKEFDPDKNFWEINPQFKYYKPYNKLFTRDKSKGQHNSSLEMWVITFMSHPDEDINIFYRIDKEERLRMLKETYASKFNEEDELIIQCLDTFPDDVLSSAQKSLKIELDAIRKRAKYLEEVEITKETASVFNMMQKDAAKVYDGYDKVRQKFLQEKAEIRARGGRKRTKVEKGEMWQYS